jgi:hypothetical protein
MIAGTSPTKCHQSLSILFVVQTGGLYRGSGGRCGFATAGWSVSMKRPWFTKRRRRRANYWTAPERLGEA